MPNQSSAALSHSDHDLFALEKEGTVFGCEPEASDDDLGTWTIVDIEGEQRDAECSKQPSYPNVIAKEGDGAKAGAHEPLEGQQKVLSMMGDSNDLKMRIELAIGAEDVEQNDSQQEHQESTSPEDDIAAGYVQSMTIEQQMRWQADDEQGGRQQQIVDIFPGVSDDTAPFALPNARDEFHDRLRMQVHRRRLRRQPKLNLYQPQVPYRSGAGSTPGNPQTATCSGCGSSLLQARYYTCKECPDYGLCCSCFAHRDQLHDPRHAFLRRKQCPSAEQDVVGHSRPAQDIATTAEPLLDKALRSAEDAAAAAATKLSDLLLQTGWRPLLP